MPQIAVFHQGLHRLPRSIQSSRTGVLNCLEISTYDPLNLNVLYLQGKFYQVTKINPINQYKPSDLFVGHRHTVQKPDRTPQYAASDQVLHCLLTEVSFKMKKKKNTTQQPLNWKWTRAIDKDGKIHSE